MRQLIRIVQLTIILFVSISCNKLTQKNAATPIDFDGLKRIQASAGGSFILSWDLPKQAQIENFEVYIQGIDADKAKALNATALQNSLGSKFSLTSETTPSTTGSLTRLVASNETSYKSEPLDEGYWLFEVKALGKSGLRDGASSVILLQVLPSDAFGGLLIAGVEGTNVNLKWLSSPTIRLEENYQYTVYKGPVFNSAIGFTKNTEFTYPLSGENSGDTIYFGVRITDGQGNEDRNTVLIPVKVPDVNKDYKGCLVAQGLGADRIRVDFEWPATQYSEIKVFRNQKEVFTSFDSSVTSFIDRGLVEGESYTYTCQALNGNVVLAGTNAVKASTLNTNPPTFSGITGVTAIDGHSASLAWGVSTVVPAEIYNLYASNSNTVDWSAAPTASAPPSGLSGPVAGLGDDLQYSFGVRACSAYVCDTNTQQITLTMPDAGAPLSPGATSAIVDNGKVLITAPWIPTYGGVARRKIYVLEGALASTSIGDYSLVKTVVVPDSGVVPATFNLDTVNQSTTYNIVVRDEDSHGQINQNVNVVTVSTGTLTPPNFNSSLSLAVGATGQEETTLTAYFKAIARHNEPGGVAKSYRFYIREGSSLSACSENYYKYSLDASLFPVLVPADFPKGNVTTITGLKPKTLYSICVKVMDKFNNISNNEDSVARQTLDTTKPEFDGIQALTYSTTTSEVTVAWNASSSTDVYEYKIFAWLKSHIGGATTTFPLARRVTESTDSFSFNSLTIPFQSQDELEIMVNACDNASTIPGGAQNCTTYTRTTALKIKFADILPPDGFLGIAALSEQGNTIPGTISVKWLAPTFSPAPSFPQPWTDYSGFKIYNVGINSTLTLLKDCPCQTANCPEFLLTCDLNDLDHYRTYTLHVRAYDEKGNITLLDPSTSKVTIRTVDTLKPTYTSNLALTFGSGSAQLDWSAATDDQYANEPTAQILYQVYRKATTNFANLLNPAADGDLLGETPNRSWTDLGPFASGENYYYTTCATDASGNRKCDGNFKMVKIPDLIAPVIDTFTTTKTATNKTWRLNWTAHDLITNGTKLVYTIKAKASTDATYLVQESDENILIQEGGSTLLDNLIGPQNTDTYMHYLLIVADEAGNKVSKQLSVYSQNKMVLTSMRSGEGPLSGSKTVFVVGDGFHSSTTVKIGNASCTSVSVITPKHLTCVTPANSAGFYTATVTNSDGSSASKADAYKYCTPGTDCTNICNLPPATGWDVGQPFAKTIGRGGSAALPYIICNAAQLQNVNTVGTNKYFELGDNIDLSSYNSNNWVPISSLNVGDGGFIGSFNGKGYAISNLTYNVPGRSTPFGLFYRLGTGSKTENMGLLNFNITAGNYVGALNGCSNNATGIITQDIVVQGNVTGANWVGGMSGEFMGTSYRLSVTGNVNGIFNVGGVAGEKRYGGTDLSFSGTVSSNPSSGQRDGHVGGIYGYTDGNSSTLSNMSANATITAGPWIYYRVGGLIGTGQNLSVTNSSFSGSVTCDSLCGGITGYSGGTAATYDNLTNNGTINGHNQAGGIVGTANQMILQNSKNFGNVSGSDNNGNVGGLVGYIVGSSDTVIASIKTSTNSGTITASGSNSGGLVGQGARLEIVSSSNSGNVNGTNETGGLIGRYSTNTKGISITGSYNTGKVTNSGQNVGGIIGWADRGSSTHTYATSFSTGDVSGTNNVGGFCGTCSGTFTSNYATGNVTGNGRGVGGFAGWTEPKDSASTTIFTTYTSNWASGKVVNTGSEWTGGFAGLVYFNTRMSKNYATGDVTGVTGTGGFVGQTHDDRITIDSNYATGKVRATGDNVGGFAGCIGCGGSSLVASHIVKNNYARGNLEANSIAGGFAGVISRATVSTSYAVGKITVITAKREFNGFAYLRDGGTATNTFWDKQTSEMTSSAGGTGKTSLEMKTPATFSSAGFVTTTGFWSLKTGSYPRLNWEAGVTP